MSKALLFNDPWWQFYPFSLSSIENKEKLVNSRQEQCDGGKHKMNWISD